MDEDFVELMGTDTPFNFAPFTDILGKYVAMDIPEDVVAPDVGHLYNQIRLNSTLTLQRINVTWPRHSDQAVKSPDVWNRGDFFDSTVARATLNNLMSVLAMYTGGGAITAQLVADLAAHGSATSADAAVRYCREWMEHVIRLDRAMKAQQMRAMRTNGAAPGSFVPSA